MLTTDHAEPQGLDACAHPDPFTVHLHQAAYQHQPSWYGALIWALRHGDDEAARVIVEVQRS